MGNPRGKRTKIWDSGALLKYIWGTFEPNIVQGHFKIIWYNGGFFLRKYAFENSTPTVIRFQTNFI